MLYAAYTDKGVKSHTHLKKIFSVIGSRQKDYNWLITDFICYPASEEVNAALGICPQDTDCPDYRFFSGEELTALIEKEDFQWIWGAFCAFEKHIPLDRILEHPLPMSENYAELYRLPVSMQHPLSCIEIYADDSSATVFLCKDKSLYDLYLAGFKHSRDLEKHIRDLEEQLRQTDRHRKPDLCSIFRKI